MQITLEIKCPTCLSDSIKKNGIKVDGKQNYVTINGQATLVIGRVAMDMIAIDNTDLNAPLGTVVELWGKDRLVDDVAEANGTIGYELLCRMSARPLRKLKSFKVF